MPILFHVILGLGVMHACLLLALLGRRYPQNRAGFACLMVAVAAVTMIIVEEWVVASDAWKAFPHVLRMSAWTPFLIGPGIWCFVKSLERPGFRRADLLHFLPAVLGFLIYLPFYLQSGEAKIATVLSTHSIPALLSALGIAKAISLIGYFVAIRRELGRLRPEIQALALVRLGTRLVSAVLVFLLVIWLAFSAEHVFGNLPVSSDLAGALGLGVFIYVFSLLVLQHWSAFTRQPLPAIPRGKAGAGGRQVPLLDETSTEAVFSHVEQAVMQDQLFRRPGLRLADLADEVGVAPHYLSFVINAQTGRNFSSWINGLRVAAVQAALASDPERPLLDLALEHGFSSKASFNRAFRKETGLSPSEYRSETSHFAK